MIDFNSPNCTSDAILVVEKKKLFVSRMYLSIYSTVFYEMFYKKNVGTILFEIDDVKYEEFVMLLHTIYPLHVPVTENTAGFIYKLAKRFKIDYVIKICIEFLAKLWEPANKDQMEKNTPNNEQIKPFHKESVQNLFEEKENLRKENADLLRKVLLSEQVHEKNMKTIYSLQSDIGSLQTQLVHEHAKTAKIANDLQEKETTFKYLERKFNTYGQRSKHEIDAKNKKIFELGQNSARFRTESEQLQVKVEKLKQQLSAAKKEIAEYNFVKEVAETQPFQQSPNNHKQAVEKTAHEMEKFCCEKYNNSTTDVQRAYIVQTLGNSTDGRVRSCMQYLLDNGVPRKKRDFWKLVKKSRLVKSDVMVQMVWETFSQTIWKLEKSKEDLFKEE